MPYTAYTDADCQMVTDTPTYTCAYTSPLRLPPWGEGRAPSSTPSSPPPTPPLGGGKSPLQHPFFQLKEEASKARRGKGTATQNYSCEFLQKVIEFLQKAIEFLQKVIEILQKVIEFLQKVGSFLQKVIKFLQKVSLASVSPPKGGAGGGSLFRF